MGARVAEQVEPGEHTADDVVARRGGARTGADGRRETAVQLTGLESDAGELARRGAGGGTGQVELGDLRRGDDDAVRGGHAQMTAVAATCHARMSIAGAPASSDQRARTGASAAWSGAPNPPGARQAGPAVTGTSAPDGVASSAAVRPT